MTAVAGKPFKVPCAGADTTDQVIVCALSPPLVRNRLSREVVFVVPVHKDSPFVAATNESDVISTPYSCPAVKPPLIALPAESVIPVPVFLRSRRMVPFPAIAFTVTSIAVPDEADTAVMLAVVAPLVVKEKAAGVMLLMASEKRTR